MLFLVDPTAKTASPVEPERFSDLGFRERYDIQEWILAAPQILGEELLIVTSEFDQFDRTSERLDVLALDRRGKLVVVELKRSAVGTMADLQALRYAAYCSTMSLDDIAELHAGHLRGRGEETSKEDAREAILEFVDHTEFEELDDKPRIILAAEEFPPEIMATVLWLRTFGVEMSCVRLRPHRVVGNLVVDSALLIPLPEAEDFLIRRERKDSEQNTRGRGGEVTTVDEMLRLVPAQLRPLARDLRDWLAARAGVKETIWRGWVGYRYESDRAWLTWLDLRKGDVRVVLPPEAEIEPGSVARTVHNGWKEIRVRDEESAEEVKRLLSIDYPTRHVTLTGADGSSSKGQAYLAFYQPLIDELREKHKFTNARVAQPANWYTFSSGIRGITYVANFTGDGRVRAECYIDVGDKDENKRLLERLAERKTELQSKFEEPLSWERLDDKRASRVAVYRPGRIEQTQEELDTIRAWLVSRLLKLREAFGPAVSTLLH